MVTEGCCPSAAEAFAALEKTSPGAPLLALGQTVLWDEPMKAGVALLAAGMGYRRRFVAGVHDTDYFAKLPHSMGKPGFAAVGHNDTTTKSLWSAAAEFSCLFGSETVVSREDLASGGVKLAKIDRARPGLLDEATEAWGWRGLVAHGQEPRTTAETPLAPMFDALFDTLQWAIGATLDSIAGEVVPIAAERAEALRSLVCDESEPLESLTLAEYYRRLLPKMHRFVAGDEVQAEVTATSELLAFKRESAALPRFDLLDLFCNPRTREAATEAYNATVAGSEVYTLDRFGSGSIPFDLVVPGQGRGTVRIGNRAIVVMTPKPIFVSLRRPIESASDLAAAIEDRLGPGCVLVGKALTLIGMLAREFVFVFHEGASGYVANSRAFHQRLAEAGMRLDLNPILRVGYEPWDALKGDAAWFRLPEPLQRPFGVDELCAPSFAARWREVVAEQQDLLERLAVLRSPLDLIRFLASRVGGSWTNVARDYEEVRGRLDELNGRIAEVKKEKALALGRMRAGKRERVAAEIELGRHWRDKIFRKQATEIDLKRREKLKALVRDAVEKVRQARRDWQALDERQSTMANAAEVVEAHRRRRDLELEAELKRLRLARQAIIVSKGLDKAGHRPSAWWFPLVSPDGAWFRQTARSAHFRLEPLI